MGRPSPWSVLLVVNGGVAHESGLLTSEQERSLLSCRVPQWKARVPGVEFCRTHRRIERPGTRILIAI